MIFSMYVHQRIGVSLIVRKLNELHIKPAKGETWVPGTIQTMLRNPVYAGKIRWNSRPAKKKIVDGQIVKERPRAKKEDWTLVDGLHKAIIDQETFDLAQGLLANNPAKKDSTIHRVLKHHFSGLDRCLFLSSRGWMILVTSTPL
jgi:site-specific DNA recombinase